jgi:hypothetical protein
VHRTKAKSVANPAAVPDRVGRGGRPAVDRMAPVARVPVMQDAPSPTLLAMLDRLSPLGLCKLAVIVANRVTPPGDRPADTLISCLNLAIATAKAVRP